MTRQEGFNGGIQAGTSATSLSSRTLEKIVSEHLATIPGLGEFWRKGYSGAELKQILGSSLQAPIAGISPDGGIFLNSSAEPIMSIECKYQGPRGNAIERWYKNWDALQTIGVKRYVTFLLGDGFFDGNTSERIMAQAVMTSDPQVTDIWGNEGLARIGFYRFRTVAEARAQIPGIIDRNISSYVTIPAGNSE